MQLHHLVFLLIGLLIGICNCKDLHLFYYLWYGNEQFDGKWMHWNHQVLPHWTDAVNKRYPSINSYHDPPDYIHSPYIPLKGLYSSQDEDVIRQHLNEISLISNDSKEDNIIIVCSWWGRTGGDTQGVNTDFILSKIIKVANENKHNVKIAFHLEPYEGRNVESIKEDLAYLYEKYGNNQSVYKNEHNKMLFYVYDSYHIESTSWQRLLKKSGDISVRDTIYDGEFVGLWLNRNDGEELHLSGFDGIYTYFATDAFSFGSSQTNWEEMCKYCKKMKLKCNLSISPGYNDEGIRPWNTKNTRDRKNGEYYVKSFDSAIASEPDVISITSFNEWGEGTNIEPSRKANESEMKRKMYLDFGDDPFYYLKLTKKLLQKWKENVKENKEL